jgi:wyosine [tRNA(Phe)-imidazoG37] synthetase (radical SAM superfamily)
MNLFLPSDHKQACNFACFFCAGRLTPRVLREWEEDALRLMDNLQGAIQYHIYSGNCTETMLNPYLGAFLRKTKKHGNSFGVKTNGSVMLSSEDETGLLTTLCHISDDPEDYFSVSLDAGFAESHSGIKRVDPSVFQSVVDGMNMLGEIRGKRSYPALRASYLLCHINDSPAEIAKAIEIVSEAGFDSIRFSQPTPPWAAKPKAAAVWWAKIRREAEQYRTLVESIGANSTDTVVIFVPPLCFPAGGYRFCAYGYHQIAFGHDGYLYRCTSVASENYRDMRLAPITSDLDQFHDVLRRNQTAAFDARVCLRKGAYCCRAGITINNEFQGWRESNA